MSFKNLHDEIVIEVYVTGIVPGSLGMCVMEIIMAPEDAPSVARGMT
jgi:hypothetical protein